MAGELSSVEADLLVYGAGMMANTHWLKCSGISTAEDGTIQVDAGYQTSIPGIYAAGTVVADAEAAHAWLLRLHAEKTAERGV